MTVRRGTSNTNCRGSAAARRKRKKELLVRDGDGLSAPCWECGTRVTFSTMICDRKKPGKHGGRYLLSNLRVHCRGCSETQGARMTQESRRWKEWHRRGLRRSRIDPDGLPRPYWSVYLADAWIGYVVMTADGCWMFGIPGEPSGSGFQTMRAALYALLVESTTPRRKTA